MSTFITGLLVKNEIGVASREEVYERWLTLQVASDTQLSIFVSEPGLLQTALSVGHTYEMAIEVHVFGESWYHALSPSNVDLNVIQRRVTALIPDRAQRAATETMHVRDYLVRGIVLQPTWQPTQESFQVEDPDFRHHTYILLETFWGHALMRQASLSSDEQEQVRDIQAGAYVEWRDPRLDLLAVSPTQEDSQEIRPQATIVASNEDILKRIAGLPLIDILKQGVKTWNEWIQQVSMNRPFLQEVDLSKCDLRDARLSFAQLGSANLSQSDLSQAKLGRADLVGANLSGAKLHETNLESAILDYANLTGADLRKANASGANFVGANLSRATLHTTDLREATFWEANLSEADLSEANLSGADLSDATLKDAILDGVDLSEATYTEEQLAQARSCKNLRRS